jgi:hypothetical protein
MIIVNRVGGDALCPQERLHQFSHQPHPEFLKEQ